MIWFTAMSHKYALYMILNNLLILFLQSFSSSLQTYNHILS